MAINIRNFVIVTIMAAVGILVLKRFVATAVPPLAPLVNEL